MRKLSYVLLLVLLSLTTYAQTTPAPVPREVEQKIAWLERQGFPAREYRWDNPAVNLNLRQALSHHRRGNNQLAGGYTLAGVGSLLTVVGVVGMTIASIPVPFSTDDNSAEVTKYGIVTATGLVAISSGIVISIRGQENNREAQNNIFSAVRLRSSQP